MNNTVYISDHFLSSGETTIRDVENNVIGYLDLKSMFKSGVSVLDVNRATLASGKFKFFSNQWLVLNKVEEQIGVVKQKFFSFSKKYTYTTSGGDIFYFTSRAFSKNFLIFDERHQEVASFQRTSSFFSTPAYKINHNNDHFTTEELIIVVMGINAIEKRNQSNAANAGQ